MTEMIERSVNEMCNLSYGIRLEGEAKGWAEGIAAGEARGRAEGKAEGKAEGRQSLLYDLVLDGEITVTSAARRAGQTEEEFQDGLNSWLAQRTSAQCAAL